MRIVSEEQAALANADEIHEVSVSLLRPNPDNHKVYDTQLATDQDFLMLCDTMRDAGRNEEPITITTDCEIISGHRRFGAAKQIGLPTLRCVIDRSARSPEIRKLKLIMHNMHRRKSRVEIAREIIFWSDAIDAFWRTGDAAKLCPIPMRKKIKQFTDEERSFLTKIIEQNSIQEDDNDEDISKLKRTTVNSSSSITLRFLGQSQNTQIGKLKFVLTTADTLRLNGESEIAQRLEALVNEDQVDKAFVMAKSYDPKSSASKPISKSRGTIKFTEYAKKQAVIGCRSSFSKVRDILASHKLWLRCKESHDLILEVLESLVQIEVLEEQQSRRSREQVTAAEVIYQGEAEEPEITAVQPTPKNTASEIESLLQSLT